MANNLTENSTPFQPYIEIDTDLLLLAARGGNSERDDVFERLRDMPREEVRFVRRALYRLEQWLDDAPVLTGG
jgi:hypothetical protein